MTKPKQASWPIAWGFRLAALALAGCATPQALNPYKPQPVAVVMDADTGRDDAWTIFGAMRRNQPAAIIASYGNTNLGNTERNTLDIIALASTVRPDHAAVPVWRGAREPSPGTPASSLQEIATRDRNNGNGLVNVTLPSSGLSVRNNAQPWATQMAATIKQKGSVDFVALGPMTDLAQLIDAFGTAKDGTPNIRRYVHRVVAMGGSIDPSLPTDFNFQADPRAAQKVITTFGRDLTLVPYDLTRQLALSQDEVLQLRAKDKAGEATLAIMRAQAAWPSNKTHQVLLHDPATLLSLNNLIGSRPQAVRVLQDEPPAGTNGAKPGKLLLDPQGTTVNIADIPPAQITAARDRLVRDFLQLTPAQ